MRLHSKSLYFLLMKKNKATPKTAQPIQQEQSSKDTSPRVHQRDKIDFNLNLRGLDWSEKQKAFIELATNKDTKIIFLSGPAGTSKSILAVYCALHLLNERKVSDIIYVRTIVESAAQSMGTLPGDENSKLKFFVSVLNDKLEELLPAGDIKRLHTDERVKGMPVNYLRGASYNAKAVIVDEAQNGTFNELLTCLTRIGKFTKYFILGDPMQSDLRHKEQSGFKPMFDIFNTQEAQEQGIYCVEFTKEDIMRSEILKFIIEQVEKYKN
jgi:phosphate starvation-inducible PhoH-like protein